MDTITTRVTSLCVKIACLAVLTLLTACARSHSPDGESSKSGWIGAWAAAPYGPYPLGPISGSSTTTVPLPIALPLPSDLPNNHAVDQSFRMIVHPTIGGSTVRVRLSNLMGDKPVTFNPVRIAQSLLVTGPVLVPNTDTAVLFGGNAGVTIAPGAEAVSDPVKFSYDIGSDLAISFHVVGESGAITWHAISFGPNYVGLPSGGDTTSDVSGLSFLQPSLGWFFISGPKPPLVNDRSRVAKCGSHWGWKSGSVQKYSGGLLNRKCDSSRCSSFSVGRQRSTLRDQAFRFLPLCGCQV